MEYILENEELTVRIKDEGAEVISVKDHRKEQELWWWADPAFWGGHSPILFPACGGLWNGEYSYKGHKYQMPKHGFVRKALWKVEEGRNAKQITFSIEDDSESRAIYPFSFTLRVTYILKGRILSCKAEVCNRTEGETLYYQLGGHPALALPDYREGADIIGYLRPTLREGIDTENLSIVRAGEQGCIGGERYPVPMEQGLIPISIETFTNEAIILDKSQSKEMQLLRADGKTPVAMVSYDAPVCLLWQQQGQLCPFVCIEPWYGAPDRQQYSVDLDFRPYSQHVLSHQKRVHNLWQIAFA